jgi:hypothetical protein
MTAVFAFDPCKAIEENPAVKIPLHDAFDIRAKKTVHPFNTILIDLLPREGIFR